MSQVEFDRATEQQKTEASVKKYAFNAYKSGQLPLRRPLRDMRSSQCLVGGATFYLVSVRFVFFSIG
jgi:hypothetical protein